MKVKNATSIRLNPLIDSIWSHGRDDNACALTAIGKAFNIKEDSIYRIFKQLGRKRNEGCTIQQIKNVIEICAALRNKHLYYVSEKNNPSLDTLAKKLKEGKYLVNCAGHLTYLKNGVYYDDYIYFGTVYPHVFTKINKKWLSVVGYWQILDKEPIRLKSAS
jgi:hypothetical protein